MLIAYQNALTATCKMPHDAQRLYVQQVTQENGSLSPGATGGLDLGYSFGIGQWYVYPHTAKWWLAHHPEQGTIDWQMNTLAQGSCDTYAQYKGDVQRSIVYHNNPRAANNEKYAYGYDHCRYVGYPGGPYHYSCYFKNEVNGADAQSRIALVK